MRENHKHGLKGGSWKRAGEELVPRRYLPMRGKWLLVSGVVILAAVAAGALSLLWRKPAPPAPVVASQSTAEAAGGEVSLPGTIEAREVVAVAVPVEGTIESFFAEQGQEVSEGQLLAQIKSTGVEAERDAAATELERTRSRANSLESRLIAARLEASRASTDAIRARETFGRAEKAYLRQQMLLREGATPRLIYEKFQREYESAKTDQGNLDEVARGAEEQASVLVKELDEARRRLAEKTHDFEQAGARLAAGQVYSPVDGLVASRRGQPGEPVNTDVRDLFEIAVNLMLLDVVLAPAPAVLARVRPGQGAVIQVAEVPGQGIPGKVREVQDGRVIVEFTSPNDAIKPGLTAQVRIKLT